VGSPVHTYPASGHLEWGNGERKHYSLAIDYKDHSDYYINSKVQA
jgi:hypothetical protein